MKRILSVFLVIGLLFSCGTVFGGCDRSLEGKVELTLALREGTYAEVVKECLKDYESEHQVSFQILEYSEEDLHRVLAEGDKKHDIDLCMVDGSWVTEFGENNRLMNLTESGYSLDEDIIPATTTISYYENNLYAVPYFGNVTVLLYNKEALEDVGCEEDDLDSVAKLIRICNIANENGRKGFLYRGDTNNNLVVDFLPILLSYGGWVVDEENHPIIDSSEFKEALYYYLQLIETGEACEKEELISKIDSGEATMAIGWPGWYQPSATSNAYYCALNGAATVDSARYNANVYGVWTLGISSESKHPTETMELLQYLMDPKVQRKSVDYGGIPCRYSSLNNQEVLEKYPHYQAICDALENGKYRPMIPEWSQFCEILGDEIQLVIDGELSAGECASEAQNKLEELLGE